MTVTPIEKEILHKTIREAVEELESYGISKAAIGAVMAGAGIALVANDAGILCAHETLNSIIGLLQAEQKTN